jgi:NAD(P)H-dependent FMN reductase
MIQLKIIIASTRSGRKGPAVADWILKRAKLEKKFKVELIDLAELNLPFLDEPEMAIEQKYKHAHTKKWSKTIVKSDAFIIVTPEYNNSYPAPIKNALDYLFTEWNYKPVGFVSYGGVAGGTRAVQALKIVLASLKMVAVKEAVNIPFFEKYLDVEGLFVSNKEQDKSADVMFKELIKWASALDKMRA